jgi:hypothetical protein
LADQFKEKSKGKYMMKKIIAIATVILLFASLTFGQNQTENSIPVKIKFVRQQGGKPPLKFNFVNLSITNNSDSLRWYLFPMDLEDSLKADGNFKAYSSWTTGDLCGRKYPDSITKYQIIDIEFLSPDAFVAICIPPKSSMTFENYMMDSNGDSLFHEAEVWEVKNLMVNGKTPLNKWMPYDVVCSKNVHVKAKYGSGWEWSNPDWDRNTNKSRTDYPKENVTFIQAVGINKLRVKFD